MAFSARHTTVMFVLSLQSCCSTSAVTNRVSITYRRDVLDHNVPDERQWYDVSTRPIRQSTDGSKSATPPHRRPTHLPSSSASMRMETPTCPGQALEQGRVHGEAHPIMHRRPARTRRELLTRKVGASSKVGEFKRDECGVRDRKSTRLNSSHSGESRMPSSA